MRQTVCRPHKPLAPPPRGVLPCQRHDHHIREHLMASNPGPMDVSYGEVNSVPIGGGTPSRPDMQFPAATPSADHPSPPVAAQTALQLADAKTSLIQTTQALASFGDATQPKLD